MFEMNLTYDTFQCISTIAFVKNEAEVLDSPIWIMLINIVALEMLGAKMPKPAGISLDYYSPLSGYWWGITGRGRRYDNFSDRDANNQHICPPLPLQTNIFSVGQFIFFKEKFKSEISSSKWRLWCLLFLPNKSQLSPSLTA